MPSLPLTIPARDTGAFLDWLDHCEAVEGGRVGAVGFCMGGGMAIAAAAERGWGAMLALFERTLRRA